MNIKAVLKNSILFLTLFFVLPSISHGATFNLVSSKEQIVVGDELNVDLKLDTEDVGTNTAQATIKFPPNILSVTKIDRSKSVFNFWLLEPEFDNANGEVSFVGGSDNGFSGGSLQVIRISFKVKGSGTANITVSDGAITASDGSGTNIFSASKGLKFDVLTKSTVNILKQISREAAFADRLPSAPEVSVPAHPDPKGWSHSEGYYTASWKLPLDISAVATAVNKNPTFNPSVSEGLFDNKSFEAVPEGVSYLHVRFKNNLGWGLTNHYRIALDSTPPLPFTIKTLSENPYTPTITYNTNDQLSGLKNYIIKVDNEVGITTSETQYLLKGYFPGEHTVKVFAVDQAGNRTESTLKINIEGIEAPKLSFITKDIFASEGGLGLSGTAPKGSIVQVSIKNKEGVEVYDYQSQVSENGQWAIQTTDPLQKGSFLLDLYAKNLEGALSDIVTIPLEVKERPFIIIFGLQIGKTASIIILLLILIGTFVSGFMINRLNKNQRMRKELIASRDVNNILNLILKDLDTASVKNENKNPAENLEVTHSLINRAKENITKMRKYLIDNINEIS